MSLVSLASLLVQETKAAIYQKALDVATALGLPVTSWAPGDPTRSLYHFLSEVLATLEEVVALYVASGFLDYATGNWLKILAYQVYGVEYEEATYATTTVTLSNGGGGLYVIEVGDLTLKNSATGAIYRNTTGGTLASGPGTTLSITVVADDAGSDGNAAALAIDTLVTTLLGVTCSNTTAAVGTDEESEASLRQRCRDKLGSLSATGPKDAYTYVARTSALTGTTAVNRARSFGDTTDGTVTVYLAGPSGTVAAPDVTLVETAILEWATPLGITPTVASASAVVVAVTYSLWIYASVGKTTAEVESAVKQALEDMFLAQPIGGNVITTPPGALHISLIESTIRAVYPAHAFRVVVALPAGDTSLAVSEVATLGAITATIVPITDP